MSSSALGLTLPAQLTPYHSSSCLLGVSTARHGLLLPPQRWQPLHNSQLLVPGQRSDPQAGTGIQGETGQTTHSNCWHGYYTSHSTSTRPVDEGAQPDHQAPDSHLAAAGWLHVTGGLLYNYPGCRWPGSKHLAPAPHHHHQSQHLLLHLTTSTPCQVCCPCNLQSPRGRRLPSLAAAGHRYISRAARRSRRVTVALPICCLQQGWHCLWAPGYWIGPARTHTYTHVHPVASIPGPTCLVCEQPAGVGKGTCGITNPVHSTTTTTSGAGPYAGLQQSPLLPAEARRQQGLAVQPRQVQCASSMTRHPAPAAAVAASVITGTAAWPAVGGVTAGTWGGVGAAHMLLSSKQHAGSTRCTAG
jgi:hypothetical protein